MKIPVQINGKVCGSIEVESTESINLVIVPGKLVNVVTLPPRGPAFRLREWETPDGECHKTIENMSNQTNQIEDSHLAYREAIRETRAKFIAVTAQRDALKVALEDVLRYCVTVKGMPDKNKGRTAEQDAALKQAMAAITNAA